MQALASEPRLTPRGLHGSHGARAPAPLTTGVIHVVGHNAGEEIDRTLYDTWTGGGGPSLQAVNTDELELFGRTESASGGPN